MVIYCKAALSVYVCVEQLYLDCCTVWLKSWFKKQRHTSYVCTVSVAVYCTVSKQYNRKHNIIPITVQVDLGITPQR